MIGYERNKATRKRKFEEYLREEPQTDHNSEPELEVPTVATMTALSMDYIKTIVLKMSLLNKNCMNTH